LRAKEPKLGLTVGSTLVSGIIIICMVMGNISGAMVDATKGSMLMIKNMVLVFITGLMADDMRVTGSMENSMARAHSFSRMALLKKVSG
jgi:hypothetical protein